MSIDPSDIDPTAASRFANLEIDDKPPTTSPKPIAPPTPPTPSPKPIAPPEAVTTNIEDMARARRDLDALLGKGFKVRDTVVTFGTPVNGLGVENATRSLDKWDKLDDVVLGAEKFITQIKAEERHSVVVPAVGLKFQNNGNVSRGQGSTPITDRAFKGMAHLLEIPGGGTYLCALPPIERADHMNRLWLPTAVREDLRTYGKATREWEDDNLRRARAGKLPTSAPPMCYTPREVKLRLRKGEEGKKEIFATVGPDWTEFDVDKVVEAVIDLAPKGAKASIKYDGYTSTIDILFHSKVPAKQYVAGEVFQAGVRLKVADDGTLSIQACAMFWRNLCLNLIVVQRGKKKILQQRHVGSMDYVRERVNGGIQEAFTEIEHFSRAWDHATVENVLEKYDCAEVDTIFKALVHSKIIWAPGTKTEDMIERLKRAWDQEPGYSKAAIVNAVTRAAHEETWKSPWVSEDLEQQSGQLLYAKVWNADWETVKEQAQA